MFRELPETFSIETSQVSRPFATNLHTMEIDEILARGRRERALAAAVVVKAIGRWFDRLVLRSRLKNLR